MSGSGSIYMYINECCSVVTEQVRTFQGLDLQGPGQGQGPDPQGQG